MASTTTLTLDDDLAAFVQAQVERGHFPDAGEVVRAALSLFEEEAAYTAYVKQALEEGEASGVSERSIEDIWKEVTGEPSL